MKVEIKNDLLFIDNKQVSFKQSPNIKKGGNKLQYLIQHYTATTSLSSPLNWLCNKESQVSAHLLIGRDGSVYQLSKFTDVCFHAGKSKWGNIVGLNSCSLGIESVNAGVLGKKGNDYVSADGKVVTDYIKATNAQGLTAMWQTYPDVQMEVIAAISLALKNHYNLKDILGHEDISPIRKTDPSPAFRWELIKPKIQTGSTPASAAMTVCNYKTATTFVNVRCGAGKEFDKVATICAGTKVQVVGCENDWTSVEFEGKKGWIKSEYLK